MSSKHNRGSGGHEEAHEGAPEWLISFADNTALIMGFFVILLALNMAPKGGATGEGATGTGPSDGELDWAIGVREAFHNPVRIDSTNPRERQMVERLKRRAASKSGKGLGSGTAGTDDTKSQESTDIEKAMQELQTQIGNSMEQGIEGEYPSVKNIRDGLEYTIGGQVSFESGRADLLEGARRELDAFAEVIQGMNTKIRIQGHAARKPKSAYAPYASLDDLSYARALAVKNYLASHGISDERMTVEACGDKEPIVSQAYDEKDRSLNRRVAIIVTEMLIKDYQGQPEDKDGDTLTP
jgi:flagellar motor protein MotB